MKQSEEGNQTCKNTPMRGDIFNDFNENQLLQTLVKMDFGLSHSQT